MKRVYKFLRSLLKWGRGGYKLAPTPVVELRWMVCSQCDERRRSWWRWFCRVCGCTVGKQRWPFNKLAMPHEACPLKKWVKVNKHDR